MFYCPHCWGDVPENSRLCPACGRALATDGETFVEKLIAAIHHTEPTRAALAIQVLSEMLAEPRAIPPLIGLLDTAHDAYVLRSAVLALGRFADRRAVPALRRVMLDSETSLIVRAAVVDALAQIGGGEARQALGQALTDPSASVRKRACQALRDWRRADGETRVPSVGGGTT